jgi:carbon storage regulator
MLVLTRKPGEKVILGGNITVTLVGVKGGQVPLGFDAPGEVRILRSEFVTSSDPEPHDPDLQSKPAEWMGPDNPPAPASPEGRPGPCRARRPR